MSRLRVGTVLAHPDDETFGVGGTLLRAVAGGGEVHSLCLTRGEGGATGDVTTPDRLGETRAAELEEAGRRLGLASVTVLDWGDGGVAGDHGLPRADPGAVEESILEWLARHPLDVLITWGPDGGYGHPDHIAAGERCLAALARAGEKAPSRVYRFVLYDGMMAAWRRTFPDWDIIKTTRGWPKEKLGLFVTLSDEELERKWHAMLAHRTQNGDLRNWERLMTGERDAVRHESFLAHPPNGRLLTDLV